MPRNLEIKARISSREETIRIAHELGATFAGDLYQIDTYFQSQLGRLKLREIKDDHAELILYQRDESTAQRLSKYEVHRVEDPGTLKNILASSMGVRQIVEKRRTLFLIDATRIHIDEVKELGSFLEIEVRITDYTDYADFADYADFVDDADSADSLKIVQSAEQFMNFLVSRFGVQQDNFIRGSYVDLLTEKAAGEGKR